MYHIRIDYFDDKIKVVRTFFEYDYSSKADVINEVLLPYLQEKPFIFGGAKVKGESIRKVEIYETQSSIEKTVEQANASVSTDVFFTYTNEGVLREGIASNITRQVIQECKEQQKLKENDVLNPGKKKEKKPMLFISHSSEDEAIASSLVTMCEH